jgi:hypothetical protein
LNLRDQASVQGKMTPMTVTRIALVAAALAAAAPALGSLSVPATVEELARGSEAVVRGHVVSLAGHPSADGRRISTSVEVETTSVWRGTAPARVTVVVPGGTTGRLAQRVAGAPQFTVGEEVVVFLGQIGKAQAYRVTGLAQGKFAVEAEQAKPDLSQTSFVGRRAPRAGERLVEAMPVDELERRVRAVQ